MKKLSFILIGAILILWGVSISLPQSQAPIIAAGINRLRIGSQVYWTTDLIPSNSFTVNLGSSTNPVNQVFSTRTSASYGEFTGYASASTFYAQNGLVGAPGYAFSTSQNTGFYLASSRLDVTIQNSNVLQIGTGAIYPNVSLEPLIDGTTSLPAYSFNDDTTTGMYLVSATQHTLGLTTNSITRFAISAKTASLSLPFFATSNASVSGNFETIGLASASKYFSGGLATCGDSSHGLSYSASTGLFGCQSITGGSSFTGLQVGVNGGSTPHVNPLTFQTNSFTFSNTASTGLVSINWGANGVASRSATNTWTATNTFNAAINGNNAIALTGTGSNSFAGSLNLTTANEGLHSSGNITTSAQIFDTGTASSSFSGGLVVTRQLYASGGLVLNTSSSTTATLSTTGQTIENTASKSVDFYDGSNQRVNMDTRCFTYSAIPVTAIGNQGGKQFLDPFTIDAISTIASPSTNSVGWNLYYGAPGTVKPPHKVFSSNHSASTSFTYTSLATASFKDGYQLNVQVSSTSAVVKEFDINVCGHYTK